MLGLADAQMIDYVENMAKVAFESAGRDWEKHEACNLAAITKSLETRVHGQTWTKKPLQLP